MTAQPDGLHPDLTELWIAENGWGYRMYKTEKQARRYAYATTEYVRDENGKAVRDENDRYITLPRREPEVYRVTLSWERVQ